jgi:signal transduction histidine kinase
MHVSSDPKLVFKRLAPFTRFWYTTSYLLLAIGLAICLLDSAIPQPNKALAVGLAALWGGWYYVFVMRRTRLKLDATRIGISFLLAIGASIGLSWLHPAFLMLAFGFYGLTFGVLPLRWAIPLVATLSFALAWRFIGFSGGFNQGGLAIIFSFVISGAFAVMLGLYISRIIDTTREKQHVIEELEATRGELAQAERQAGILEERQRLAGEIHDTLAQDFTSVVLHLEAAEQALGVDPTAARQHLDQARAAARQGLSEARSFVWALRPDVVRHEPLAQALRRVAGRWSEECGVPAHLELSGEPRALPAPIEATLLRAAQETLVNVRKHARAAQVNLTLTYMEDEVILDVQDDGAGFQPDGGLPPDSSQAGGYGLVSLRERAAQLGGSLQVESAPGEGTTVVLGLPTTGGN